MISRFAFSIPSRPSGGAAVVLLALMALPLPSIAGSSSWIESVFGSFSSSAKSIEAESSARSSETVERLGEACRAGFVRPDSVGSGADDLVDKRRVAIFTKRACGYCNRAKAFFKERGIAYEELDIERSACAKAEFDRLNGRGVPLIVVDDRVMNGFSERRATRLLAGS